MPVPLPEPLSPEERARDLARVMAARDDDGAI